MDCILPIFRGKRTYWWATAMAAGLLAAGCSNTPEAREARFLKRGQARMEKKEYTRARLEFQNAIKTMPKDAEPHYQLGLALLALNDVPHGMFALRKATRLNPKHTAAQLKLAELMAASRSQDVLKEAAGRLEGVLAWSPDDVQAINALALTEWRLGKTDAAERRLEEALKKFPTSLRSSLELAQLKLSREDRAGAEEELRKAAASAPQSAEAAVALGELYAVLGKPDGAEREFRRALQLDAQDGPALMGLAALQVRSNRLDEAERTLQRVSALPDREYRPKHAIFLYETGKREAALAEFEKLAKEAPGDREARTRLVWAYVEMSRLPQAQNLLTAALKKNPKDTGALLQRSQLYLQSGRPRDAEEDLRMVLRFKPDSAQAHYALALVHQAQGSARVEQQELGEALRLDAGLLPARLALSRNRLASDPKSALQILDDAPASQRKILAVILARNWVLLHLRRPREVRAALDEALRAGRLPSVVLQDAVLRMVEGDYNGARASAEEVLKQDPEEVQAATVVFNSYVAQKQPAKAGERLKQIVAARPKSAVLQHLLGRWYLNGGDLAAARSAFEAAKAADARFVEADFALAHVDRREKRLDAGRQRLTSIVAADPRNVRALLELAGIEELSGNTAAAIARYRAVLELDRSNFLALNNLAYQLSAVNPGEALTFAQQAAEIMPDNATVQDTLGCVYYRKGLYSAAVRYLKAAVAKEPTPRREFHLAMSYLKSGEQSLGQKTLRAALQKDPNILQTEKGW